jgi:hypothetical protein
MKYHTPLIFAALLALLFTGCSKHPTVANLGVVEISDGIPTYQDLGGTRACVITPTVLKSNMVRLAITIQATNSAGVVQTVATTSVDIEAGKPRQISIGDNFDIRLTPQIKQ